MVVLAEELVKNNPVEKKVLYELCELPDNWKWAKRKNGSYFVNPIDEIEFKIKHEL